MKKYSKGEIAKIILLTLGAGTIVLATATMPGLAHILKLFNARSRTERARVVRSLKTLEEGGYLYSYKKSQNAYFKVTDKGAATIDRLKFEKMKLPLSSRWDKKWRIVIFDIPENKKNARNALSLTLKRIGFYSLQRSVFVYPHECQKEVYRVADYFKVRRHIKFMLAQKIDGDTDIKKHFKL